MKVAIMGETLRHPLTGVGHYTTQLAQHLDRLGSEIELTVVVPENFRYVEPQVRRVARRPFGRLGPARIRKSIWELFRGPRWVGKQGFDIIHACGNLLPFALNFGGPAKRVLTIHDLTPLIYPETHRKTMVWSFRFQLPRILRRIDGWITDSEASREDIFRFFPGSRGLSHATIPLAADEIFFTGSTQTLDPPDNPYFLCVGTVEPRKNLARVLKAFQGLVQEGHPHRMVIAGFPAWGINPIRDLVGSLGLENRVDLVGYVPSSRLADLYHNATALVYPSLYEGFGLPILEAMAAGCPVITSNRSSMLEVASQAAILVDPEAIGEIGQAMKCMVENEGLRRRCIAKGQAIALNFNWHRTAKMTADFYKRVLES